MCLFSEVIMLPSIRSKVDQIIKRYKELEASQAEGSDDKDYSHFEKLGKEMHSLYPIVTEYEMYQALESQIVEVQEMIDGGDGEMVELAREEITVLDKSRIECEERLMMMLLPEDPDDDKDIYLEIRAGAGGDEASLFVGDLARMYLMFADQVGWKNELVSQSVSSQGGYKEVVYSLKGKQAYRMMKYESGTHRVQRIPVTESQGRIHTSTVTVAILPQVDTVESVDVLPQDLRIDTFRASGAGGQHVNTTDSAVRITHIPTNTVVECQDERSQHKNKAKAMALLSAKILQQQRMQQQQELSNERSTQVGSGERSERIRTYNFPQGRMTDHRIGLTLYRLEEMMQGDLNELIEHLIREDKAKKLAGLTSEE